MITFIGKYYNSTVMTQIWQQLFKRQFDVPERSDSSMMGSKRVLTTTRKEYFEMIHSMFKVMVNGISNDIAKTIEKMQLENMSNIDIFIKLK